MDRWMEDIKNIACLRQITTESIMQTNGQTYRKMNAHIGSQMDIQLNRQTDGQTDGGTDEQTDRQTDRVKVHTEFKSYQL